MEMPCEGHPLHLWIFEVSTSRLTERNSRFYSGAQTRCSQKRFLLRQMIVMTNCRLLSLHSED